MTRARKLGIGLLIGGGLFAAWSFGAGLIAFWFVVMIFIVIPGIILMIAGRGRRSKT